MLALNKEKKENLTAYINGYDDLAQSVADIGWNLARCQFLLDYPAGVPLESLYAYHYGKGALKCLVDLAPRSIGGDILTKKESKMSDFNYNLHGGDNGNYQITQNNKACPVAFVRRNPKGGGYTATLADESTSVYLRNLPNFDTSEKQAFYIMELIKGESQ